MMIKKVLILFVILISIYTNIKAQRVVIIKDSTSQKNYFLRTNKSKIIYSLKSNPYQYYEEEIISYDSLGIIFNNESFKPIHYSEINSFAFKPISLSVKAMNRAILFTTISMDLFIYISTKRQNQFVGYYIFSISAILYGATSGLIALTNELATQRINLNNIKFNQFSVQK